MTLVYFVRHGRTDWNRDGLYRGRADRSLDEVGLRQAELVRDALKAKGITKIYSSPMIRTVQTVARLSGLLRKQITAMPGLSDID